MITSYYEHWPKRLTKSLTIPKTSLFDNLAVSAKRYPGNIAIYYYGGEVTYRRLFEEVDALAGYLQHKLGVAKGERVLLFMQNSPQFAAAFYAINRADAVVVPINPMLTAEELAFYINDCEIKHGLISQELYERVEPLLESTTLTNLIVAAYSDYIAPEQTEEIPDIVKQPRRMFSKPNHYLWNEAIGAGFEPGLHTSSAEDIAVLPYTSGTTGLPKGCLHTNSTVQANTLGAFFWGNLTQNAVSLATLPFFHVTGMVHSLHSPIYAGGPMVIMTRWNKDDAARWIEKYQCTHWVAISTMIIDFLYNPNISEYDISSLASISGGGAPLPEAVGEKLLALTGLKYFEGYGLSETIAQTHFNPPDRPKLQCLGVPSFDVDARIVNPDTLEPLGVEEIGEIVVNGPQVFNGYFNRPDENEKVFFELDGKTFFRTGDIGRYDAEGYFFMVDRVKRMINASGLKVWPTEVESLLYKHPAIKQACVVGVPDPRKGETVKAFVILNDGEAGKVTEEEIIEWSKGQMAAYKYPRIVEFTDSFPTTSSGKILWRKLQEEEWKKAGQTK